MDIRNEEQLNPLSPFYNQGDREGDTIKCAKCGFLRLRGGDGTKWCRSCRYTFYDEYFGPDGINEKWLKEHHDL